MKRTKAIEARQHRAIEQKSGLLKNIETAENLKLTTLIYHAETLVTLSDVSVCYDEKAICEPVSFTIQQGDRVVLDGRNGSGKSSLLKLIIGEPIEHTGTIQLASGLIISMCRRTPHIYKEFISFR